MRPRAGSTASRQTTCSTPMPGPRRRAIPCRNGMVRPSPDDLSSATQELRMIHRLIALVVLPVLVLASAQAEDWKSKFPELVVAAAPAEQPTAGVRRWTP